MNKGIKVYEWRYLKAEHVAKKEKTTQEETLRIEFVTDFDVNFSSTFLFLFEVGSCCSYFSCWYAW